MSVIIYEIEIVLVTFLWEKLSDQSINFSNKNHIYELNTNIIIAILKANNVEILVSQLN